MFVRGEHGLRGWSQHLAGGVVTNHGSDLVEASSMFCYSGHQPLVMSSLLILGSSLSQTRGTAAQLWIIALHLHLHCCRNGCITVLHDITKRQFPELHFNFIARGASQRDKGWTFLIPGSLLTGRDTLLFEITGEVNLSDETFKN